MDYAELCACVEVNCCKGTEHQPCVTLLLQQRTLLMLAAGTGQIQLMDLLIKKGVAVKSKDNAGRTALQVGAVHGTPVVYALTAHMAALL
jgi:ankyrin repeat protein